MTGVLIERGDSDTEIHRKGRQCGEAQGKDIQGKRPKTDSPYSPRREQLCQHLDCRLLAPEL